MGMYKVSKEFVDYVCGKNNEVNANELTAEITKEYGENYEVKLNKKIPCIFGDTDIFGIMKVDFDKNFVKI